MLARTASHGDASYARPSASAGSRSLRSNDAAAAAAAALPSPTKKDKKHVVFQLIDPQDPRIHARLPLRVMISPDDSADSIIATIKNFYGLYEFGVSLEDKHGIGLVAAYDNFEHDMTFYVRTVALPPPPPVSVGAPPGAAIAAPDYARDSASPKRPTLGPAIDLRHGLAHGFVASAVSGRSPSRSAARSAGARSQSPLSDAGGRRSASVSAKPWPSAQGQQGLHQQQQRTRSRDTSAYGGEQDGYSSGDGDNPEGSVASSRRSKAEPVNAEISIDNIVEGGRRKRAFESSELPLFVPPQVPMTTSISSVSPQRRAAPPHTASPYAYANGQTFAYQQPLPSPRSYGGASAGPQPGPPHGFSNGYNGQASRQLRARSYFPPRHSGQGVLPTPDPTVGSAISDEDVAIQLMRLGDPTAFSHGRTSTSTADDALSGKAEAASSDEEDDEDAEEDMAQNGSAPARNTASKHDAGPLRKKQRRAANELPSDITSGDEYEDVRDATFASGDGGRRPKASTKPRNSAVAATSAPTKHPRPRAGSSVAPKPNKTKPLNGTTNPNVSKGLVSPASMPAPSRKGSVSSTATGATSTPLGHSHAHAAALCADEDDLSSKPRCQRCRKSKKGCDRQRPCGRCRDAGIGIEGCVSEDEGNGRKGRYGRHMGVPIKRASEADDPLTAANPSPAPLHTAASNTNAAPFDPVRAPLHASGTKHAAVEHSYAHGNGHGGGNHMHMHMHPSDMGTAMSSTAATMGYHSHGTAYQTAAGANANAPSSAFLAPALPDKNKKRKR